MNEYAGDDKPPAWWCAQRRPLIGLRYGDDRGGGDEIRDAPGLDAGLFSNLLSLSLSLSLSFVLADMPFTTSPLLKVKSASSVINMAPGTLQLRLNRLGTATAPITTAHPTFHLIGCSCSTTTRFHGWCSSGGLFASELKVKSR